MENTQRQIKDLQEGDVIALFGHTQPDCLKRVVFCERLGQLSLQNKDVDAHVDKGFQQNVRGSKDLSTFAFLSSYEGHISLLGHNPIHANPELLEPTNTTRA
jgi:hypothetical protein